MCGGCVGLKMLELPSVFSKLEFGKEQKGDTG